MKKVSPYLIIVASFLSLILVGTILLFLPISQASRGVLNFVDSFFLATSAVTNTGLSPVADLSVTLTLFGKIVLIVLVQIGGLSVVTFSVFIMYLIGVNIGIGDRVLIKETFNQDNLSGMVKLVKRIVIYTFIMEFIAFVVNLFVFVGRYDVLKAVGISAFHAISSFNNAGFDLLGNKSLQAFNNDWLLNINTMIMIMMGGLGFIVVNDIYEKRSLRKLSIHSKIVLKVNLVLWVFGMLIFKISEHNGGSLSWLEAIFLSVTARTAGFSTINTANISALTTLVLIILMFIGGAPSSTAGGIKVTTFYTLVKGVSSFSTGRQVVTSKRLIDTASREKASLLLTAALLLITFVMIVILLIDNVTFENVVFESVAAFSNTGLTNGTLLTLHGGSRAILALLMFAGRVGPLTLLSIFNNKWYKKDFHNVEYIEEKVMIG